MPASRFVFFSSGSLCCLMLACAREASVYSSSPIVVVATAFDSGLDMTPPSAEPAPEPLHTVDAPVALVSEPTPFDEIPGADTCAQDADCTLTKWEENCCFTACEATAVNAKSLAQRIRAQCKGTRSPSCPPPRPCAPPQYRVFAAACRAGYCTTLRKLQAVP